MATMAMAEMAMAMVMAKATAMMLPPPPIQMMLMTTMAEIQGRQLDDGNWMTTMGQRRYASMMTATTAMAETAKAMAMATTTATETVMPMTLPPLMAKMSMKMTAAFQERRLDINNGTTSM